MTQLAVPFPVNPEEIMRKPSLGAALSLCLEVGGVSPKELQADLGLDKAQWSRWESGQEGVCWPKLARVMDHCGNDAPVLWMAHQRKFDLSSMHKLESELERQNRLLREENMALRRVLRGAA
jgi:plasmid maintenance system antidote protein VapI